MLLEISLFGSLHWMIIWFEIGSWPSFGVRRILWQLCIKIYCLNLSSVCLGHLLGCPTLSVERSVVIWGVPHVVETITCVIHTLDFSWRSDICWLSVSKATWSSTVSPRHMDVIDLLSCSFPLFWCLPIDAQSILCINFGNGFSNSI